MKTIEETIDEIDEAIAEHKGIIDIYADPDDNPDEYKGMARSSQIAIEALAQAKYTLRVTGKLLKGSSEALSKAFCHEGSSDLEREIAEGRWDGVRTVIERSCEFLSE